MEVAVGLPGDEGDAQSRYIEAVIPCGTTVLRVGCLYLPNGNPLGTEKYLVQARLDGPADRPCEKTADQ